jgi:putative hemolysin
MMTPRPQIIALDLNDTLEANVEKMVASPHSYFPVYQGNPDQIVGFVSVKQLWAKLAHGQPMVLSDSLIKPLYVMKSITALRVLEMFKQSGKHIALVLDEYGGTAGLISIIDLLEAIAGDLPSLDESPDLRAVKREDGSWLVDGMLSIDEFKEIFQLDHLDEEKDREEDATFQTLGGFVMFKLGRIPKETDKIESTNYVFEVVDMDGHRVDKILLKPTKKKT